MKLLNFFQKFFTKPSTLLGVDVDHYALRLTKLKKVGATYCIQSCHQFPFPQENVAGNFSWENPEFLDFLKKAIKKSNIGDCKAALALPYTSVLFKTIELDKRLTETEIEIQVNAHAKQYFNYPISELMIDFELFGTSKNHPDLREVQLVAVKRSEVMSRVNTLEAAGLLSGVVEVDSYSLQRAAIFFIRKKQLQESVVAVIHIHFFCVFLIVFYQGFPIFTRVENSGFDNMGSREQGITESITCALKIFLSSATDKNLSLILLSGCDVSSNLLNQVYGQTSIETQKFDIFSVLEKSIDLEEYKSHEFLISVGLAMRKSL